MSAIQVAIPINYNGKRYFVNDLQGVLTYLWDEMHYRAGGAERLTKPKAYVMYTANLRGFTHFYDTFMAMEAEFDLEGVKTNGKQTTGQEEDV